MTIAFGDLQGCHRPLQQLLEQIKPSEQEPLWFCGDLINRGPDSLGSLREVYRLGKRARVVLGNHDLHLLAAAVGIRSPKPGDTITPILKAPDRDELLYWLRTRPLAVREGDFLMVHAGLAPQWHVEQVRELAREVETVLAGPDWQDFLQVMYGNQPDRWSDELCGDDRLRCIINILTRSRYLYRDDGRMDFRCTDAPDDAPAELVPWFEAPDRRSANSDVTIIFGHWSSLGLQIRPRLMALDSGCVWGGCLSAVRLESREVFQQQCPPRSKKLAGV